MSKICPISWQSIRGFAGTSLINLNTQFARPFWIVANLRWTPHSVRKYRDWAEAVKDIGPKETLNFADWVGKHAAGLSENERGMQYVGKMDETLSGQRPVRLDLSRPGPNPTVKAYKALVCDLFLGEVKNRKPFEIENSCIRRLLVQSPSTTLHLRSCNVEHLQVHASIGAEIHISGHTVIGTLEFCGNSSVNALTVINSSIIRFVFSGPECITGRVILKKFWMERDEENGGTDAQTLRSIRANLNKLHNTLAAGVFHSAELCVDRKHERFISRAFSYLYEIFSDYGNSISRPVKWFIFSLAAIMALGLIENAVQIAVPDSELKGWQQSLQTDRWLRAFVFSVHSVLNPLGIFSTRQILISSDPVYAGVFTFLSILGIVAIAFILIGLRRRFRLE